MRTVVSHVSRGDLPTPSPLEADPPVMWPVMYAGKPTPPLWTQGMTHACEKTTLPQTSFVGGN